MEDEKQIGKIIHFYPKISVGIIELTDSLSVGETIHIKGASSDFEQTVDSMQVEHENIEKAKKGDVIGLKVTNEAKEGDLVYK